MTQDRYQERRVPVEKSRRKTVTIQLLKPNHSAPVNTGWLPSILPENIIIAAFVCNISFAARIASRLSGTDSYGVSG
jgi:hypothetical protein